jgi:valyl-tRNA synthetase
LIAIQPLALQESYRAQPCGSEWRGASKPKTIIVMATRDHGDATDDLYKLPLDEFTSARNTLARESGDNEIKKLEKPNLAAWAVNQLYWRERKLYDDVIKTSTQVRTAYKQMLAGKAADVKAAEVFHTEAMRKAKDAIRRMLEAAGNNASDAVMTPVTETLDALPTTDPPGRLAKPLRRTGFEALQGVTIAARPAQSAPKVAAPKPAADESDKDRKKREAEQQELAMARERLRFAEAAEREAEAAVDRARRTLERAERTRERIEGELEQAAVAEKAARKELSNSESALVKASAERERLRKKVG